MSLDLRNFVQVNINYHTAAVSSAETGVVTLITVNSNFSTNRFEGVIFHSYSEYISARTTAAITDTSLDLYVKTFFDNKGKGLQIIYSTAANMAATVAALDYRFIIIVSDCTESQLETVATASASTTVMTNPITRESSIPTFSGINEKIYISSFDTLSNPLPSVGVNIPNFIIKMGKKGCEMLTAAFLSQVRVDSASTISDYNFTIENIKAIQESIPVGSSDFILVEDNDTGVALNNLNYNFDTTLVNAVRNIGGNSVGGADIINYYMRIVLTQTLTEKIMSVLVSKIKLNQSGINRVQNAIQIEMARYTDNGYLNTDYIWTGDDLHYTFHGVEYLVCSRNEPLVKGYKCVILPISSLSLEEKESHAFPPVYLLLADQSGIRAIVINGDVY